MNAPDFKSQSKITNHVRLDSQWWSLGPLVTYKWIMFSRWHAYVPILLCNEGILDVCLYFVNIIVFGFVIHIDCICLLLLYFWHIAVSCCSSIFVDYNQCVTHRVSMCHINSIPRKQWQSLDCSLHRKWMCSKLPEFSKTNPPSFRFGTGSDRIRIFILARLLPLLQMRYEVKIHSSKRLHYLQVFIHERWNFMCVITQKYSHAWLYNIEHLYYFKRTFVYIFFIFLGFADLHTTVTNEDQSFCFSFFFHIY